jgi:hypothetical protein
MISYCLSSPWYIVLSNSVYSFLWRPVGRLWVLTLIRLLKTSSLALRTNRFFECPKFTKCVQHHETSLYWNHQSRIQRADNEFSGPFPYLKLHLMDFIQNNFSMHRMQKINSFRLSTQISLHRLHQNRFLSPPEGRLWFHRAFRLLKTKLKRITRVAFFDVQNAKNEFVWTSDYFIYRFNDFTKVVL